MLVINKLTEAGKIKTVVIRTGHIVVNMHDGRQIMYVKTHEEVSDVRAQSKKSL